MKIAIALGRNQLGQTYLCIRPQTRPKGFAGPGQSCFILGNIDSYGAAIDLVEILAAGKGYYGGNHIDRFTTE